LSNRSKERAADLEHRRKKEEKYSFLDFHLKEERFEGVSLIVGVC
jgi:hypothetical protein